MILNMIWVKSNISMSMKRFFTNVMLIAVSAMTLFACQKPEVQIPEVDEFVLTFASEKPAFSDDTKTEWNGESVQWSAGDRISVAYTVNEAWQNAGVNASADAKMYKSVALDEAADVASFNVSTAFRGNASGAHVFYGIYPAPEATSFAAAPVASLTVPAVQVPRADSFDPRGDLMVAASDEHPGRPAEGETISLKWNRLVAHAHITLKTLNGFTEGETITGITLTAQDGANLVGQQKVNVRTGEVVADNAASNVLNLVGDGLVADASGNITFWACILPAKVTSLKVEVNTDAAIYTREISSCDLTFKQNARNTLAIKMDAAKREAKVAEAWTLVSPSSSLEKGTYVLVVKTDTKTGALISSNGTGSAPTFYTSGLSIDGNTLNGVTDAMKFDLSGTKDNYELAVAGQTINYLYTKNDNNGVRVGQSTNKGWQIITHPNNANAFLMKSTYTSRYLGVYNNQDWRCYTDYKTTNFTNGKGSCQIYLYKKTTGSASDTPVAEPTISVAQTIELSADASEGVISATCENVASVEVNAYADEACTLDCNWLDTEWIAAGVAYSAGENDGEARTAYVRIYATNAVASETVAVVKVIQAAKAVEPDGGDEPGGDDPQVPVEVEATLSFVDKANRLSFSTSQQVWSQNGVTVTNDKSSSTNDVADYANPARFYSGSSLTIDAGGNEITKIVFTCNGTSYVSPLTTSIGSVSGASVTSSGSDVTVKFTTPVTSFTIAKLSAQIRMNSITITYMTSGSSGSGSGGGDGGGGGSEPTPSPDPTPEPEPDPTPDVPSSSVTPAVNQDWLELPGAATGGDYVVNTYYDGSTRNYTHLYDKKTYTSLWTAYALNSSHMGSLSRPGSWSYSPSIETAAQVNLKSSSYNDNYSRGHMIPNASRNGNSTMQKQTFFVTNSVPQIQNNFNSGIWSSLENALQSIGEREEIYIVTGVTFNKVGESKTIKYTTAKDDTKNVPVPNYFYKVVLKVEKSGNTVTSASAIGFWFEHKTYSDNYSNYAVSVDQIEQWTGFDFFVNLPDSVETAAETNSNWTTFQNF